MRHFSGFSSGGIFLLIASLMLATGCNKEKVYVMGTVTGTITLDDQPVKQGCVVVFHPVSGDTLHGSSVISDGGKYEISQGTGEPGIPVGDYKVTISPPPLPPDVQKETERKNQATIMQALVTKNVKSLKQDIIVLQTDVVPQVYWSQGSTPLKVSVKEGQNSSDFKLTPEKPKNQSGAN
jgi:hypothetical protein